MTKRLLIFILLMTVAASTSSCYVTRLAFQQNALINSRQPIARVLSDPTTPPLTRDKLQYTREILAFAAEHGLNVDGAYGYYIQLEGRSVSYIVQAAYADRLESVTNWFPVVGRVPYLGFFKAAERDAQAEEYRRQGFDVTTGGASAFSSLGWFDDPVYSSMLRRPDSELAHLFFHELTHRTLWVRGSTEFNENLAEFVGGHLTKRWLEARGDSAALGAYQARREDRELLREWVRGLKQELEQLYKSPPVGGTKALLEAKVLIFNEWHRARRPKFAVSDLIGDEQWNNATVLATTLYSPETARFERAYRCAGEPKVGDFLQKLDLASKKASNAFKALDSFCPS